MSEILDVALSTDKLLLLLGALFLALVFECANGFHDTANAVATVIYTHSLPPTLAVVWSGLCNFFGVLLSSGAVAFGIVSLLPIELILNVGSGPGFAMVFALLLSAILWNFGTWYAGVPASSSHTLIGSIVGVGLMESFVSGTTRFGEGVNWGKLYETITALLLSPVIGFILSALLLLVIRMLVKNKVFYEAPADGAPPPWKIRALLILTCTGVSFAHGSNDGQKGMGLLMLILIGVMPSIYALNLKLHPDQVAALAASSRASVQILDRQPGVAGTRLSDAQAQTTLADYLRSGRETPAVYAALAMKAHAISDRLAPVKRLTDVPRQARRDLRGNAYVVGAALKKLMPRMQLAAADRKVLNRWSKGLGAATTFIPLWVKVIVALALGLGTMIGWRRIVVTVGEKIGRSHLTYAQGVSAEAVTMATIEAADLFGLPVSTTHVLSSGIAGTMAAMKAGLQKQTLKRIIMAWVLTLPVTVFLGAVLFAGGLFIVFHVLGLH